MANHRELAQQLYVTRIWRTVVFAGAMLGAPLVSAGDAPPAQAAPKPAPPKANDKPTDKPADAKPTPKVGPKQPTAKATPKPSTKRPRASDNERPTGRGFILS